MIYFRILGFITISWFATMNMLSCAPEPAGSKQGLGSETKDTNQEEVVVAPLGPSAPENTPVVVPPSPPAPIAAAVPAVPAVPVGPGPVPPPPLPLPFPALFAPAVAGGGGFGHDFHENECRNNRDCFDDDPCTIDVCEHGECEHTKRSGCVPCDSDRDCTVSGQVCLDGVCQFPPSFSISGSVVGLSSTGLILQNNGANNLLVPNGATSFIFPGSVPAGSSYSVSVFEQPLGQICSVSNASGIVTSNVTNIVVTCAAETFTIGGTITGLSAAGLVLQNNGSDNLSPPSGATSFVFPTPVASGAPYNVTVLTQPAGLTCSVTNGSGIATANVTNVSVTCIATPVTFTIGGTITGLSAAGLVLQNNGGDNLSPPSGATSFVFPTPLASGAPYNVTVLTQPPGLTCSVTNGSGIATANVTNVSVTCIATPVTFTIGGIIARLTEDGLVLQNNGGDNLALPEGAISFVFPTPVASGGAYNVTVFTQPPDLDCGVTNGSGTATANVTNILVTCSPTKQ